MFVPQNFYNKSNLILYFPQVCTTMALAHTNVAVLKCKIPTRVLLTVLWQHLKPRHVLANLDYGNQLLLCDTVRFVTASHAHNMYIGFWFIAGLYSPCILIWRTIRMHCIHFLRKNIFPWLSLQMCGITQYIYSIQNTIYGAVHLKHKRKYRDCWKAKETGFGMSQ